MKRVHALVAGQVQGVFFRAGCAEEARRRGLGGYVRNLPDGRVEAAFEGDDRDVDAMVEWCRSGTDWAQVESVEVSEESPKGEGTFEVDR